MNDQRLNSLVYFIYIVRILASTFPNLYTSKTMASEEMRGTLVLQQELEKAKFRLKDVNENIKKITGRDPDERRDRHARPGNDGAGRGGRESRLFSAARRSISGGLDGPPAKRRAMMGGAFSRLGPRPVRRQEDSGDEEEDQKHTVQSSVVAASVETRTKSLEKQSKDREGMARNRRMFGMILGTLQRFKTEAKDNKDKEDCRRKLEKKLDDKAEKEKNKIRQETRNLIDEKRLEVSKIRRLEQKMDLVQEHESIKLEMTKLANFLCTKAKPPIFYVPKKSLPADDIKLKDSVIFVNKMIEEKKANMEKEIEEMMNRENEREERIRSRIAERSHQESGEEEEDEDDHHDDLEDHEDDQKAIDDHKAAFREDKENRIKKEPMSDNESSVTHGEGFTVSGIKQEETDEDNMEDDDIEGEGSVEIIQEENVGKGQSGQVAGEQDNGDGQTEGEGKNAEENEREGGEDKQKQREAEEEEIQDGGMVNTVGGAARQTFADKDKHSQSKSTSKDHSRRSDRHDDKDRQRTRSGHRDDKSSHRDDKPGQRDDKSSHRDDKPGQKDDKSSQRDEKSDRHRHRDDRHGHKDDRSSRRDEKSGRKDEKSKTESKKSSHRRSRSRERRDKHRHSKHHSEDKSKRSRHDSSSDDEVARTGEKGDSQPRKPLEKSGDGENAASGTIIDHDLSSIQLPPSDTTKEIQASEQVKRSGDCEGLEDVSAESQAAAAAAAERERKIVMAEDEEEMDDHPADE